MKILVTRTDRMGDVILSTPVLRVLREEYPEAYIAMMVRPYAAECVEGNPYIDEVILYDKYGKHKGIFDSLKFAMELKHKSFDIAIVLHPTTRMHLVTFIAGISKRVGYDRKCGALLTHRIPHKKEEGKKHEREYTLDILKHIGIDPKTEELYMPVKRDILKRVEGMLQGHEIEPKDRILAIHPSSSCPSKRWLAERFASVADGLAEDFGLKIVLISDKEGEIFSSEVARHMKSDSLDLSAKMSIGELAALIKRSTLFISNDSGPVHIASAVSTPVISIFGRKDPGLGPIRWGPVGKYDIILHKDAGCKTCLAHNCTKDFLCLKSISVDEVIEAAKSILQISGGNNNEGDDMQRQDEDNKLARSR